MKHCTNGLAGERRQRGSHVNRRISATTINTTTTITGSSWTCGGMTR
jgi:hypothetical protein